MHVRDAGSDVLWVSVEWYWVRERRGGRGGGEGVDGAGTVCREWRCAEGEAGRGEGRRGKGGPDLFVRDAGSDVWRVSVGCPCAEGEAGRGEGRTCMTGTRGMAC